MSNDSDVSKPMEHLGFDTSIEKTNALMKIDQIGTSKAYPEEHMQITESIDTNGIKEPFETDAMKQTDEDISLVDESRHVVNTWQAEEIKQIEKAKLVEETRQVEKTQQVEGVRPTEEIQPAEQPQPTPPEDTPPVEETTPVEDKTIPDVTAENKPSIQSTTHIEQNTSISEENENGLKTSVDSVAESTAKVEQSPDDKPTDSSSHIPAIETPVETHDKELEKSKEETQSEDDAESSDDEPQVGLLERPLILEKGAKREKKKVVRLDLYTTTPEPKPSIEIKEGNGIKLTDCPYIDYQLQKQSMENIRPLHAVLYQSRRAPHHNMKYQVKQFSGYTFQRDDKLHEKTLTVLGKFTKPTLSTICDILGLDKTGLKDVVMDRIIDFLMKPHDHGKVIPSKGKKRPQKKNKKKKTTAAVSKSTNIDAKDLANLTMDVEDEQTLDDKESDVESEEEKPAKKPKVSSKPEKSKKDSTKKNTPKKVSPKKVTAPKKSTPKSSSKKESRKSDSTKKDSTKKTKKTEKSPSAKKAPKRKDDSETSTPAAKKVKGPPTNDELKDRIKKILDTADLELVTMKTVLKQVSDLYPDYDLSERKAFMKNVVRQLIS